MQTGTANSYSDIVPICHNVNRYFLQTLLVWREDSNCSAAVAHWRQQQTNAGQIVALTLFVSDTVHACMWSFDVLICWHTHSHTRCAFKCLPVSSGQPVICSAGAHALAWVAETPVTSQPPSLSILAQGWCENISPERGKQSYKRVSCGATGWAELFFWPGRTMVPWPRMKMVCCQDSAGEKRERGRGDSKHQGAVTPTARQQREQNNISSAVEGDREGRDRVILSVRWAEMSRWEERKKNVLEWCDQIWETDWQQQQTVKHTEVPDI